MSYQVLARKWRPQVFEDVVGQGHITRTLQNAITSGRLAHAFLFSGPRGVGKTTTARILAKALNCAEGPTPTPCGECDSCAKILQGIHPDVVTLIREGAAMIVPHDIARETRKRNAVSDRVFASNRRSRYSYAV